MIALCRANHHLRVECIACVWCPCGPTRLHQCLPLAYLDHDVLRRNNEIADDHIRRAVMDWLDLVVKRNVGKCDFHDMGSKPSPRAALVMIFVNIYTINIKKGREGWGSRRENGVRNEKKKREVYVPGVSAKTKYPQVFCDSR